VDPRRIFEAVQRLPVDPDWITISRSVSSGYMPLRYRFFADYLAALWRQEHETAAHLMLGILLGERGSLDQALRHLEDAHRIAPAWSHVMSALAQVHGSLGRHERAEALMQQVREQRERIRQLTGA
jgi:lipopolysaccharide biosynthesis regulator YciM